MKLTTFIVILLIQHSILLVPIVGEKTYNGSGWQYMKDWYYSGKLKEAIEDEKKALPPLPPDSGWSWWKWKMNSGDEPELDVETSESGLNDDNGILDKLSLSFSQPMTTTYHRTFRIKDLEDEDVEELEDCYEDDELEEEGRIDNIKPRPSSTWWKFWQSAPPPKKACDDFVDAISTENAKLMAKEYSIWWPFSTNVKKRELPTTGKIIVKKGNLNGKGSSTGWWQAIREFVAGKENRIPNEDGDGEYVVQKGYLRYPKKDVTVKATIINSYSDQLKKIKRGMDDKSFHLSNIIKVSDKDGSKKKKSNTNGIFDTIREFIPW